MNRYVCIHGHFYQPPRDNPWLDEIEVQDSAYPYHDWNERITTECYAPNTASRILDHGSKIIDIVNNYSRISFNFGPTLLSWMEDHDPETYQAIIEADRQSQQNFGGHGSAIAQTYNHIIMPLANTRDKRTQIIWGIKDFEHRFGRRPEGMWLAETAVDLETLDILAEHGILFTILAPRQAKRVRKIGKRQWRDVSEARIDPKRAYLCNLPSGKKITIFFYDGPTSQEVAFGGLLISGEQFAKHLINTFTHDKGEPQLCNISTDGETYGHHHSHGDMALSYCLYYIQSNNLAQLTVYGEFLEKYPPIHEVEIFENSSWSCIHGIERWRSNCGCNSGKHHGWTQEWRGPLRGAMDWLRDNFALIYEEHLSGYVRDPWQARDEYIDVILNRTPENIERFFSQHAVAALSEQDKINAKKLLEMQRYAMFMYASCGWFFDEISGIETVQVLQYAARAIQLAKEVSGVSFEEPYIKLLERAPSNIPEYVNGSKVYEMFVKPAVTDLVRVGAHYAVSSLFRDYSETSRLYSYTISSEAYDSTSAGKQKLAIGKARMRSDITGEGVTISFAVLYLGNHNLIAGAYEYKDEEAFQNMHREIKEAFLKNYISETVRLIDKYFSTHSYSLWHLFKDEQRNILNQIFENTIKDVEASFRKIYEEHSPMMQVANQLNIPLSGPFATVAEFVHNQEIRRLLESGDYKIEQIQRLVEQGKNLFLTLDKTTFAFIISKKINKIMENFFEVSENVSLLDDVIKILEVGKILFLEFNLWKAQNMYFYTGKKFLGTMRERAESGDEAAKQWIERFTHLGEYLKVSLE